jgi:hypothetical protein
MEPIRALVHMPRRYFVSEYQEITFFVVPINFDDEAL